MTAGGERVDAAAVPGAWARWRAWINRDDGGLMQVDNRALSPLEILGHAALVMAMMLWLLHDHLGWSAGWSIACAVVGVSALAVLAMSTHDNGKGDGAEACPVCGGSGEVEVVDEEVGCRVQVPCEACGPEAPVTNPPGA